MAISLQIYSNAYNTTKTVSMDFVANIATIEDDPAVDDNTRYFFKITTSARDTSNLTYTPRIITGLSDLALNKNVQSASNTRAAYTDIGAMISDYVFDYVSGHVNNKFSSGCTEKDPMKFSS